MNVCGNVKVFVKGTPRHVSPSKENLIKAKYLVNEINEMYLLCVALILTLLGVGMSNQVVIMLFLID